MTEGVSQEAVIEDGGSPWCSSRGSKDRTEAHADRRKSARNKIAGRRRDNSQERTGAGLGMPREGRRMNRRRGYTDKQDRVAPTMAIHKTSG